MRSQKRLRKLCDKEKIKSTLRTEIPAESSDFEEEYSLRESKFDNSSSRAFNCEDSFIGDEVSHSTKGTKNLVRSRGSNSHKLTSEAEAELKRLT